MNTTWIRIGGILHFGILIASALVPGVLDWKGQLAQLPRMLRQLIWTHGAFIVLTIILFGALSVGFAGEMAARTPLARGICAAIGIFWLARLALQVAVFDAREYLRTVMLKVGYHALTLVFAALVLIYGASAIS